MARGEWNDNYLPSPAFHFGGADNGVLGVIAALDDDIGLEMSDEIERRVLGENYDEVDALQRGENVGALGIRAHRTRRSLETTHRLVTVDADDQSIGGISRREKHVDVTRVEQIEDAVGERNPTLLPRSPALGFNPRRYLCRRITRLQSLLAADGWK